jgi:hypothetical protein
MTRGRGTQLKSHGGQKIHFNVQRPNIISFFTNKKDVFFKSKLNKQNLQFCGPHLARGLYVVHAWPKVIIFKVKLLKYIFPKVDPQKFLISASG